MFKALKPSFKYGAVGFGRHSSSIGSADGEVATVS